MCISIGPLITRNGVFLAPMSGVTDEAFRTVAHEQGAGLVVSEMVASEELVHERPDMVRRARGRQLVFPFVVQLAGREAWWMAEGARVAQDLGADVIDINMGCPSRQVTGGLSGSALMRDLNHAIALVEATIGASRVPVTLKMRLGWDDSQFNAPELARLAEASGVSLITVHGRTRCQFYAGRANWAAIRRVREAIAIPLIANGDCISADSARQMLDQSGADGVMIGRGAYGRPWWPAVIAKYLGQDGREEPTLDEELEILLRHQQLTIELYGEHLGNKTFRKHLGWTIDRLCERGLLSVEGRAAQRAALLVAKDNNAIAEGLTQLYARADALAIREAA